MVDRTLIFPGLALADSEAVIRFLAERMFEKGYVRPEFPQAVVDREKKFPTGLPSPGIGVAIPHTDAGHVLVPCIGIATLKTPVRFKEMGNLEKELPIDVVFMLAIQNPKEQLETIKKLMGLITDSDRLRKIYESEAAEEIYEQVFFLESDSIQGPVQSKG